MPILSRPGTALIDCHYCTDCTNTMARTQLSDHQQQQKEVQGWWLDTLESNKHTNAYREVRFDICFKCRCRTNKEYPINNGLRCVRCWKMNSGPIIAFNNTDSFGVLCDDCSDLVWFN